MAEPDHMPRGPPLPEAGGTVAGLSVLRETLNPGALAKLLSGRALGCALEEYDKFAVKVAPLIAGQQKRDRGCAKIASRIQLAMVEIMKTWCTSSPPPEACEAGTDRLVPMAPEESAVLLQLLKINPRSLACGVCSRGCHDFTKFSEPRSRAEVWLGDPSPIVEKFCVLATLESSHEKMQIALSLGVKQRHQVVFDPATPHSVFGDLEFSCAFEILLLEPDAGGWSSSRRSRVLARLADALFDPIFTAAAEELAESAESTKFLKEHRSKFRETTCGAVVA